LSQKPWIVPIPGMDKTAFIDDNLRSIEVNLNDTDLKNIDVHLAKITIMGDRLDAGLLSMSE